MTIKQYGGVFGRNPTFNDVNATDITTTNLNATDIDATGLILRDDGGAVGIQIQNDDYIKFETGSPAAEAARFNSTGNLAFPSGQGIDFSATAGTGTSELLDDYEEGTWTGTFSDGTNDATMSASFTTGQYVKIGSMVMVSGYFVNTSIGSMSGAVRITGLPFPSGNANSYSAGGGCAYGASLAITANQSISTYLAKNTDYINLMLWDGAAGASTLQASELSDGGQIVFSLTYIAA
jgi:hypothetical protein